MWFVNIATTTEQPCSIRRVHSTEQLNVLSLINGQQKHTKMPMKMLTFSRSCAGCSGLSIFALQSPTIHLSAI